jgi:hypothetical protein
MLFLIERRTLLKWGKQMQDFDTSEAQNDDRVEITDLDPQTEGSGTSLSIVLLRFARKIPFLANTRAKNTALSLLICGFALLFLVQPDLSSSQASRTRVSATSSSLLVQSPSFIVEGSSAKEVIWIKISNGVEIVRQAPAGIIVWHHCKLLNWHVPPKYQRPIVVICT